MTPWPKSDPLPGRKRLRSVGGFSFMSHANFHIVYDGPDILSAASWARRLIALMVQVCARHWCRML